MRREYLAISSRMISVHSVLVNRSTYSETVRIRRCSFRGESSETDSLSVTDIDSNVRSILATSISIKGSNESCRDSSTASLISLICK